VSAAFVGNETDCLVALCERHYTGLLAGRIASEAAKLIGEDRCQAALEWIVWPNSDPQANVRENGKSARSGLTTRVFIAIATPAPGS